MPLSPLCVVSEGTGPFVPTLNGVDVSSSATVAVKLTDATGVVDWFLRIIGTDELSSPPILSGVDPTTYQVASPTTIVTLTFPPGIGRAVGFRSEVTGVGGPIITTFGVYSLTDKSTRVGFVTETREGDATFGWVTKLNPLIRNGGGGASGGLDSLEMASAQAEDGDQLEPGKVYPVVGPGAESSMTFSIAPLDADEVQSKRVAIKLVSHSIGRINVLAPEGQLVESDNGQLESQAAVDLSTNGEYREWQADPDGNWLLVSKVLGPTTSGHGGSHQSGGFDEIDVTGLHGLLADPQRANIVVASPATNLSVGAVADGQFLRRSGAALIGAAPTITTSPNPQWWDPPAAPNAADFEGTDSDLKGWVWRRQTDWTVITPDPTPINVWTSPAANTFRVAYGTLRRSHLSVQPAVGYEVALCKQFPANSFPNGVQHSIRFSLPQQQVGQNGQGTIVKFDWNLDSGGTKPAIDWRGQQIWAKAYGTGALTNTTQIGCVNYSNYQPNDQMNTGDLTMVPLDYEFILCWDKTDTQSAWLRSGSVLKRLNGHAVGWPGSRNGVVWLVIRFGCNSTTSGNLGWQGGGVPIFHLDYIRQVDNEQVS